MTYCHGNVQYEQTAGCIFAKMCGTIHSMPTKDKGDLLLVTMFGFSRAGGPESCTVV